MYRKKCEGLAIGDLIRFTRLMIGILSAHPTPWVEREGKNAWIIGIRKDGHRTIYNYRMAESGAEGCFDDYESAHVDFEIVDKGNGTVTPGVTYPFTEHELMLQRMDALKARVLAVDWTYQGYTNAPTFLASTYLRNDRWFMDNALPRLWRKDGTVNPDKLEKAFNDRKIKIDSWAFEFPFDIPTEFCHHTWIARDYGPRVNWEEVARDFVRESA